MAFGARDEIDQAEVDALRSDALADSLDVAMAALRGAEGEACVVPADLEGRLNPLVRHHVQRQLVRMADMGLEADAELEREEKEGTQE